MARRLGPSGLRSKMVSSSSTFTSSTLSPFSTSSASILACVPSRNIYSFKDVRAHCYCPSLVRTLYMTWHVPRHVFQARAPSPNSAKYRADDLYRNLICEYFCWMLGDPHFFFGRSFPFLILSIILKNNNKKICTWEVLIFSHLLFK